MNVNSPRLYFLSITTVGVLAVSACGTGEVKDAAPSSPQQASTSLVVDRSGEDLKPLPPMVPARPEVQNFALGSCVSLSIGPEGAVTPKSATCSSEESALQIMQVNPPRGECANGTEGKITAKAGVLCLVIDYAQGKCFRKTPFVQVASCASKDPEVFEGFGAAWGNDNEAHGCPGDQDENPAANYVVCTRKVA